MKDNYLFKIGDVIKGKDLYCGNIGIIIDRYKKVWNVNKKRYYIVDWIKDTRSDMFEGQRGFPLSFGQWEHVIISYFEKV